MLIALIARRAFPDVPLAARVILWVGAAQILTMIFASLAIVWRFGRAPEPTRRLAVRAAASTAGDVVGALIAVGLWIVVSP